MDTHLLILGGTTEATALAHLVHEAGISAVFSYAGRVARPKRQPLSTRIGGFGGVEGLVRFIKEQGITHLVDATHPFAAQMSHHAVQAAAQTGIALCALTRPPWQAQEGDNWQGCVDIAGAVAALEGEARRVMLAIGRMHLAAFAPQPQHHYVLRLVDAPEEDIPLPRRHVIVDQGPFTLENDMALMRAHKIDVVVCKNAGGTGARAKIDAARALHLPVLMIERPKIANRLELGSPAQVLQWLAHGSTDLGV